MAIADRIVKGSRELKLSNLDKVFFPVEGITKGDLLEYYRAVAPVLIPHLRDRPFTMVRWPDGVACPSYESQQVIKRGCDDTEPARQCRSIYQHL